MILFYQDYNSAKVVYIYTVVKILRFLFLVSITLWYEKKRVKKSLDNENDKATNIFTVTSAGWKSKTKQIKSWFKILVNYKQVSML